MKNIDSEVANFHQKMAKSMHSLLKAFTEGFAAMDKAKSDELVEIKERKEKRNEQRIHKMSKINSGIQSLQQLTSKLKMTFQDQDQTPPEQTTVQTGDKE